MNSSLSFRFAVIAAAATLMLGNTLISMQGMAQTSAKFAAPVSVLIKAK